MKESYIRITKTERNFTIAIIIIMTILGLISCFKGISDTVKYSELVKEKEALEEIIEVQKEQLNEF